MNARTSVVVLFSLLTGAIAGWYVHRDTAVHAAEVYPAPTAFQLQGSGPDAQLAIYDSVSRTISVYQGVGSGSDSKPCSYQLQLGRSGTAIRRTVCAPGTLP